MAALSLESSILILPRRVLEYATSIFQLSFLPCSGTKKMCLVVLPYKTSQNIQIYQEAKSTITTEDKKLVLFWTKAGEGLVLIICWERLKKSRTYYSQLYLVVCVFVWAGSITAHMWERKLEDCEDVLQDLPFGRAQPDILKVSRNKSCWGFCWFSIVPLAISAPRQEVTLTVCRFTTFLLKSKLLQRKGETRIKHKCIKKQQCEETKPYTLLNIAI